MNARKVVLASWVFATVTLGGVAAVFAHGSDISPYGGQHMGPMRGYGMGPGMMGPGHGMHPGMMGPGHGMHPGMMGRGYGMGMQPLRQDLSAADVRHMMEHRLKWGGNPHIKVGKVEEKDDDTIVAEIVTQDGSLVDRLQVDRHTGMMQPVR